MEIILRKGLPQSHKFIHRKFEKTVYNGIVWDVLDVEDKNTIYVYQDWAKVHFNSDWYELTAQDTTTQANTLQDVNRLLEILKHKQCDPQLIIDMHCGSGRHLIELSKLGFNVVGFEGAELLRNEAISNSAKMSAGFNVYPTSKVYFDKYLGSADVVTSFFNSMGYTFNIKDDIRRIREISHLIKSGGFIFIDYRSGEYQQQKFQVPSTHISLIHVPQKHLNITCETYKVSNNDYLAAKEIVRIRNRGKVTIAQYTTYGWMLYSLKQLESILSACQLKIEKVFTSYYSNKENVGERIFILASKH